MLPALNADPIDSAEASDPMAPAGAEEKADPTQITDLIEKALFLDPILKIEFTDHSDHLLDEQDLTMAPPSPCEPGWRQD